MLRVLAPLCLIFLAVQCAATPGFYRPQQEYRTINAVNYEVVVQKNGQVDILLRSGEQVFGNVRPMVWYDGAPAPVPMTVDGRFTMRQEVNDRLGQGQGMLFGKKECRWVIRVYPDKPFLAAQVEFINTTKRPVRIQGLSPWAVRSGRSSGISIGPQSAQTVTLQPRNELLELPTIPPVAAGDMGPAWHLVAMNPAARRALIAGFLTQDTGSVSLSMGRSPKARDEVGYFDMFDAMCRYEPAVEVAPGGSVQSEVFYIAVNERSPLEGVERFGHAVAVASEIPRQSPILPHGWDPAASPSGRDIDEAAVLRELDAVERELKPYGWTHFTIGPGWERAPGDWQPHPERFPRGLKPLVDEIHRRGMTAGLVIDAFAAPADAPTAREHPDWFVAPVASAAPLLGDGVRILDVTVPGAYEYARDLFARAGGEWGFDVVEEARPVFPLVFGEGYSSTRLTRLDVVRTGLQAVKEGLGTGRYYMGAAPASATGRQADIQRMGRETAPVWDTSDDAPAWGARQSLTYAARNYYFAPYLWYPFAGAAYFDSETVRARWDVPAEGALSIEQSRAWLTALAMGGGVVRVGNPVSTLGPAELDILRRLLPTPMWPARPVDMFESAPPRIWSLQMRTPAGPWNLAGVFNWNTAQIDRVSVSLVDLGLNPDGLYAVYDFWRDQYLGIAQSRLNVEVAPGGVRLLAFRPYEKRPIFLSASHHFTQGATDISSLEWDGSKRELRGVIEAVPGIDYRLRLLVPEEMNAVEATVTGTECALERDGEVATLGFRVETAGPTAWRVRF